MIPVSMLVANSAVRNRVSDVANKKICRFCLNESDCLLDLVNDKNRQIIASCFSVSIFIEDKLPKYACEQCYDFVGKFCEFQKLRRKAEVMLMSSLMGSCSQRLEVPEWLKSDKKRKLSLEHALPMKRICGNELRNSEITAVLNDPVDIPAGSISVSSHESVEVQSLLQSPTITSEDLQLTPAVQSLLPEQVAVNGMTINQPLEPQSDLHYNQSSQNSIILRNGTIDNSSGYHLYKHSDLYAECFQPSSHVQLQFQQSSPLYQLTQQVNSLYQPTTANSSTSQQVQLQSLVSRIQPSTVSNQSQFQCLTCSYRFLHLKHLNFHNRQHLGQEGFHCAPCGERFQYLVPFIGHLEQKHPNASFCFLCGQHHYVSALHDWKHWHFRHHLSAKFAYACDFCFLIFTSQHDRIEHYKRMHWDEAKQTQQLNST